MSKELIPNPNHNIKPNPLPLDTACRCDMDHKARRWGGFFFYTAQCSQKWGNPPSGDPKL